MVQLRNNWDRIKITSRFKQCSKLYKAVLSQCLILPVSYQETQCHVVSMPRCPEPSCPELSHRVILESQFLKKLCANVLDTNLLNNLISAFSNQDSAKHS